MDTCTDETCRFSQLHGYEKIRPTRRGSQKIRRAAVRHDDWSVPRTAPKDTPASSRTSGPIVRGHVSSTWITWPVRLLECRGGGDPEVSKRTVAPVFGSDPPRMDGCGLTWTRIPSNAPRRRTRWFSNWKVVAEIRPGARGYVLTRVPNRAAGFDPIGHASQLSRGRSSTVHAHMKSSHRSPCTPSRPPKASVR